MCASIQEYKPIRAAVVRVFLFLEESFCTGVTAFCDRVRKDGGHLCEYVRSLDRRTSQTRQKEILNSSSTSVGTRSVCVYLLPRTCRRLRNRKCRANEQDLQIAVLASIFVGGP